MVRPMDEEQPVNGPPKADTAAPAAILTETSWETHLGRTHPLSHSQVSDKQEWLDNKHSFVWTTKFLGNLLHSNN